MSELPTERGGKFRRHGVTLKTFKVFVDRDYYICVGFGDPRDIRARAGASCVHKSQHLLRTNISIVVYE